MDAEERLAHARAAQELRRVRRNEALEEHLPRQAVAVGVESGGREPEEHVARGDRGAVHDGVALHDAHDAACEVVVARAVEVRHLGGLAADERAAVLLARLGEAAHDGLEHVRPKRGRREVVQEEERLRAADGDVVDAMVDEILADRIVLANADGDLELGADAVDGGDEHGVAERARRGEVKEPAERADLGQHAGRERLAHGVLDPPDGLFASLDVNSGLFVRRHGCGGGAGSYSMWDGGCRISNVDGRVSAPAARWRCSRARPTHARTSRQPEA